MMQNCLYKFTRIFLFSIIIITSPSCRETKKTAVSFYYWKTSFALSKTEKECIKKTECNRIYTRFFDIDRINDSLVPQGTIVHLENFDTSLQCIPVVFITNRSFMRMGIEESEKLAHKTIHKIKQIATANNIILSEIQIDCDWSSSTKQNYFHFLKKLKEVDSVLLISCTIRLHQAKYPMITGIPPVDKGSIMCYNIGKLKGEGNSIYNTADAEKYIKFIEDYPLPSSLALPIFGWGVLKKADGKIHLLNNVDSLLSENKMKMSIQKESTFLVDTSFLCNGIYFKKNDTFEIERLSAQELLNMADELKKYYHPEQKEIIFFDLDERNINFYTDEKIKNCANRF